MTELLTRHLRGQGRRIAATALPDCWVPHPVTARKIGADPSPRDYAKALRLWRETLRVGCLKKDATEVASEDKST